jgi:hypothetical protein
VEPGEQGRRILTGGRNLLSLSGGKE